MRDPLPDPRRWKDEREQANLAERAAGETLRSLRVPAPLTAVELARIAARVRAAQPRPLRRLVFVLAALLLGVATAASAAHLDILPTWITGESRKAITSVPHDAPKVLAMRKGRPAAAADMPVANEPAPAAPSAPAEPSPPTVATPPSAPVAGSAPAPAVALPSARKPAPKLPPPAPTEGAKGAKAAMGGADGKPPAPSFPSEPAPMLPTSMSLPEAAEDQPAPVKPAPLVAWSDPRPAPAPAAAPTLPSPTPAPAAPKRGSGAAKHLSETIRILRVEHDAKTALALLDRHAAELDRNTLGHEALILRVEALLALDREPEVLRLLDGTALTDVAASHSLLLTRGRLRAAARRCADGMGDFSLVLAESRQPDRQALFGRALCRKQLGDPAGARADLERYRREFPADPRLGELEHRLGTLP